MAACLSPALLPTAPRPRGRGKQSCDLDQSGLYREGLICVARQRSTRFNAPLDGAHERGVFDLFSFGPHLQVIQVIQVGNRFRASGADGKDVAIERRKSLQRLA